MVSGLFPEVHETAGNPSKIAQLEKPQENFAEERIFLLCSNLISTNQTVLESASSKPKQDGCDKSL